MTVAHEDREHEIDTLVNVYGHDRQTAEELVDLRARLEELEARGFQPLTYVSGSSDDDGGDGGTQQQQQQQPDPPAAEQTAEPQSQQPAQPASQPPPADPLTAQLVEAQQRGDQAEIDALQAVQRGRLIATADENGRPRAQPAAPPAAEELPSPSELQQQLLDAQAEGDQAEIDRLQSIQRARLFGQLS